MDKLLTSNCKLRKQLIEQLQKTSLPNSSNIQPSVDTTAVDMEDNDGTEDTFEDNQELDMQKLDQIFEQLAKLQNIMPPLAQKTMRFASFVADELSDDKFQKHLERLGKVGDDEEEIKVDFDTEFRQKLELKAQERIV